MKPLLHPSIDDLTVEGILHALADPVRVAIFARLASADCPQRCTDLAGVVPDGIPKSSLSQHFKALRDAGLIRSERRGVEMHNTSRCAEVDRRFPGLLAAIVGAYKAQSGRAKGKTRR